MLSMWWKQDSEQVKKMGEIESARETKIYNKNLCDRL